MGVVFKAGPVRGGRRDGEQVGGDRRIGATSVDVTEARSSEALIAES
jgi:hypothetical protein